MGLYDLMVEAAKKKGVRLLLLRWPIDKIAEAKALSLVGSLPPVWRMRPGGWH
jgi:hypothetical protein